MEAHLQAWLGLLVRWSHFIAGVAWVGASFYFNWLENRLQRQGHDAGIAGDLWAIHGGGFYHLRKYSVAPGALPPRLHWFKWEAYATWLSGMALLVIVFYLDAQTWMVDPAVAELPATLAVAAGLAALAVSWAFYDALCRSRLAERQSTLALLLLGWFALLAWALGQLLSGRAAYIHAGAAAGTIMVANVFRVIIPAQKELVGAVAEGREPDPLPGAQALLRSRHNNYLTLPVLFVMISSHYPVTWSHEYNWLVLVLVSLVGVCIRHFFNIRHLPGPRFWPLLPAAAFLAAVVWLTAPRPAAAPGDSGTVTDSTAMAVVRQRCAGCHAAHPQFAGFTSAPLGVELDSPGKLARQAERVYRAVVVTRTMPLGNLTQMSEPERRIIAAWFEGRQDGSGD
jgi:uncharacterized membrane protein